MNTTDMNTQLTLAVALDALIKTYGSKTRIFALPKTEFDSIDTLVGAVLSAAGYDERPRNIINAHQWWGISTEEFGEILKADLANQFNQGI